MTSVYSVILGWTFGYKVNEIISPICLLFHLFLDLKLIKYIELCQKVDNIIKLIIDSLEDKLSDF